MFVPLAVGAFGLIVGSFLNVLILRHGERSLLGRSACPSCKKTIRWRDLIPVFSWILLRGRCRDCGSAISIQYPLVEAGTAVLFFFIALAPIALSAKILALPIASLLLAIAAYDFHTTYIPDSWVWTLSALALLSIAVFSSCSPFTVHCSLSFLAGPLVALPLFAMWIVSRGTWMGLGDAKLALSLGWLLGISGGFSALLLAFMLGATVSISLLFISSPLARHIAHTLHFSVSARGYTMKSEVPFGPFLVAACFLIWFAHMYGYDVFSIMYSV